jgi:hypothetical protein
MRRSDPSAGTQWRQRGHPLDRGVTPRPLVGVDSRQRHDLLVEPAAVNGPHRTAMTRQSVFVEFVAAELPLLGNQIRRPELGHLFVAVARGPSGASGEGVRETPPLGRGVGR